MQTGEFLSEHHVQVLESPANSTDLLGIENVWKMFKHNVEKKQPKNLDDLCRMSRANNETDEEEFDWFNLQFFYQVCLKW